MSYPILITLHLFCAVTFIGVVFFEVLILESVRKNIPNDIMPLLQQGITSRARQLMPYVMAFLFLSGFGMAHSHFPHFSGFMSSCFGQF